MEDTTKATIEKLRKTENETERTNIFREWLQAQSDDVKLYFAINWRIPHSLFNVACKYFDSSDLQNIDWFTIWKNKTSFTWSHGGQVY